MRYLYVCKEHGIVKFHPVLVDPDEDRIETRCSKCEKKTKFFVLNENEIIPELGLERPPYVALVVGCPQCRENGLEDTDGGSTVYFDAREYIIDHACGTDRDHNFCTSYQWEEAEGSLYGRREEMIARAALNPDRTSN